MRSIPGFKEIIVMPPVLSYCVCHAGLLFGSSSDLLEGYYVLPPLPRVSTSPLPLKPRDASGILVNLCCRIFRDSSTDFDL